MSPYLRGKVYYTRPSFFGKRYGPWSCGTSNRKLAEGVEQTIKDLPLTCPQLVPHLVSGRITPVQVRAAALANGMMNLVQEVERRPLEKAIKDYILICPDQRTREGGVMLQRLIKEERRERGETGEVTVSWLTDPRNVKSVLARREREGAKRNTVVRTVKRFIMELLRTEGIESTPVMRAADYRRVRDRRNVLLAPAQIQALLDAAEEEEYRHVLLLAVTTGVDLSPILRIKPEDFRDPVLTVRDHKTASRERQLALGEVACVALRTAIARSGASYGERIFGLSAEQCKGRWKVVRERAGLLNVRFKDLRGVFATYSVGEGAGPKELQALLGHSNPQQSIEYTSVVRSSDLLSRVERAMGLRRLA